MAAITNYAEWTSLINPVAGWFSYGWGNGAYDSRWPQSTYQRMQQPSGSVTAPGVPVALNNTDQAALLHNPNLPGTSSKQLWLSELEWGYGGTISGISRSLFMIYDRLSHMSGLDTTLITEQTVNLPTAPLTRYINGVGVQIFLEFYASQGSTAVTATCRYTNQDGVPNRVSQPSQVGGAGLTTSLCFSPVSLADGDTGVRSVEGITLSGSTGIAGNMGITLLKPLAFSPMDSTAQVERTALRNLLFGGGVIEVLPDACLALALFNPSTNTGAHGITGRIGLVAK